MKPDLETLLKSGMLRFARWCGRALACAHARSGQPAVISGYLGRGDALDLALAAFATAYADQTERDYEAVRRAASIGRLETP